MADFCMLAIDVTRIGMFADLVHIEAGARTKILTFHKSPEVPEVPEVPGIFTEFIGSSILSCKLRVQVQTFNSSILQAC